jgi:hypothetical protein
MAAERKDLTGKVFGKLTVLEYSHSHKSGYCTDECRRIGENKKQQIRRARKRVA